MGRMFLIYLCAVYSSLCINTINVQEIIRFPDHVFAEVGSSCSYYNGGNGYCEEASKCPVINDLIRSKQVEYLDVRCDVTTQGYTLVCCKSPNPSPAFDISPPDNIPHCGSAYYSGRRSLLSLYRGNDTAEEYIKGGFTITPIEMLYDHLIRFEYSNGTYKGTHAEQILKYAPGGEPARRVVAVYMALMGIDNEWLCDGSLINREWILTAAHCFQFMDYKRTVVRLGEYDAGNDTLHHQEYPLDFSIIDIEVYPEYTFPSAYHDLALIRLNKETPFLRYDIQPVCLPWGGEVIRTHVGNEVTLTGWGATIFEGPNSPVLQEVNVTVFDPSVCDLSYSTLGDYKDKFPNGMSEETTLCAGDEQGGKDACQGDSGGPVVYLNNDDYYTLAGVVSTGYGCGLKEYPGIYVPINNPKYLAWIKRVAFRKQ